MKFKNNKTCLIYIILFIVLFDSIFILSSQQNNDKNIDITIKIADIHTHLDGDLREGSSGNYDAVVENVIRLMDKFGIKYTIALNPPSSETKNHAGEFNYKRFLSAIKKHPDKFGYLGGGGILNPMIHKNNGYKINDKIKKEFKEKALQILEDGAIGFGEMSALHLSFGNSHPFHMVQPNHPLFLMLADIAAEYDVPIDLHMESIPEDMETSEALKKASRNNPKMLEENLTAFKELLSYNNKTKIIWDHAGWDHLGIRTPDFYRGFLKEYQNLYISIKIDKSDPKASFFTENKILKPEWIELISEFPEHFMIGSDQFYSSKNKDKSSFMRVLSARMTINGLPEEIAKKVAFENAIKVYKLDSVIF